MLERELREGKLDGEAALGRDDSEPVAALLEPGEHDVHVTAELQRVVQRFVVRPVDAHELVDAVRIERDHLRF